MKRREAIFLVITGMAIFALIVVLIMLMTIPARAAEATLPAGINCEMVREKVAEHGKAAALAWALEHGLSIREIWQIRRTCKV